MRNKGKVLLLNGPNLNLLGRREPEIYGSQTLDDIIGLLHAQASGGGVQLDHLQSNAEYELIEAIHATDAAIAVINPGGLTHTSVALRDAFLGVDLPFIEVHLSNIHAREPFRHHSFLSDKALGVIAGLGAQGYEFALTAAMRHLKKAG
ncbi:type II 3-dehydroquinate dehydratase [Shewanella avicenniae]|uniref:3-dehydroquinate dehydratase n=1 Tax=Shewanella avicenniae TaxID=2814294 RepID=A0ABX7QP05_9GAMM|nr:type II 3-dehydroquinate dehydratase [Shewanella avicenniae]QSX33207.1 type II 3-dehydroquinate dehydratase [Shewanella avicenniae]